MGATIFPAAYKTTSDGHKYLGSIVPPQTTIDPDFGEVTLWTPWELHLTYSSIMYVMDGIGIDVESDQYSGSYPIDEFVDAVIATNEQEEPPNEQTVRYLSSLTRICMYGLRHGATHICWG